MPQCHEKYDFVIVGSGGGSFCAALVAKAVGLRPLIIEKQDKVGGSTGYSGGVIWIPNNPLLASRGIVDSYDRARSYLDASVGPPSPGSTPARREVFLRHGPPMVEFLLRRGMKFVHADGWPDYYDELPGGEARGRSLIAPLFDINRLGDWAPRLSRSRTLDMPVGSVDVHDLMLMKRTLAGRLMALRVGWNLLRQRLSGTHRLGFGAAVQGRMLQIALHAKIPIWTESPVEDFISENDRVVGVNVRHNGKQLRVAAATGVLINVGSFSRNQELRERYMRHPTSAQWTNANFGDTGEVLEAAMALGAATDCMDEAWWMFTSLAPGEKLPPGATGRDGRPAPFMHHIEIARPYNIVVDQDGRRFMNESSSYMENGRLQYDHQNATGRAIPSWVILDGRHRQYYFWSHTLPGKTPQAWFDSGYMKRANTLRDLARHCGIDADGLESTVKRFNGFCRIGVDQDFKRGARASDRYCGDPTVKPNPNLGAIEKPPFYAVAIYPGDVGTCGGLVCDHHSRVLKSDGRPIEGLYATGNSTASVMGRVYPAAGASIAASMVFGYIAARHAAGVTKGRQTR